MTVHVNKREFRGSDPDRDDRPRSQPAQRGRPDAQPDGAKNRERGVDDLVRLEGRRVHRGHEGLARPRSPDGGRDQGDARRSPAHGKRSARRRRPGRSCARVTLPTHKEEEISPMEIKTSWWFGRLPEGHLKIGVSRGTPRGTPAGYRMYRPLQPGPWFNSVSVEVYKQRYFGHLKTLNPTVVVNE